MSPRIKIATVNRVKATTHTLTRSGVADSSDIARSLSRGRRGWRRDGPYWVLWALAAIQACVIYAAESTEDRRGSIPDQVRACPESSTPT